MMFHSDRLCEIIIIKKVSNKTWTKTKKRRVLKKIRTRVILPLFYFFFSYTFGINVRINLTQHCEKQFQTSGMKVPVNEFGCRMRCMNLCGNPCCS